MMNEYKYLGEITLSDKELELLLAEDDENMILEILQKNEIMSWSDIKKYYNLK